METHKTTPTRNRSWISALIIGISVIISCCALAWGITQFRSHESRSITATGSASTDFESDLIIWRGSFSVHDMTTVDAYAQIKQNAGLVEKYLSDNGIGADEMVFSSVEIYQQTRSIYDDYGNYIGQEPDGYNLYQTVTVSSSDLDKVERISRDISSLLESGVEFSSNAPEYYCTTLDTVKMDLIDQASINAKERIDILCKNSGATLSGLKSSSLGVFQITAKNSGTSSYSYDGAFDTSSRTKTASITVKLEYDLK